MNRKDWEAHVFGGESHENKTEFVSESDKHVNAQSVASMGWLAELAESRDVADHVYVIGGAVRNYILGKPIKDVDLVIDSVSIPHKKKKDSKWFANAVRSAAGKDKTSDVVYDNLLVAKTSITGDLFHDGHNLNGVDLDIVTARSETYPEKGEGQGHRPESVKPTSIKNDVMRREFTFNTLMWKLSDLKDGPNRESIVDLTGHGLEDLETGVIRCPRDPDTTFDDDATRMVRAVKFTSQYGFDLAPEVEKSIRKNRYKLKEVDPSNLSNLILDQFLRKTEATKKAASDLKDLGLMEVISEIARESKPFRSALANGSDETNLDIFFHLMDVGFPVGKKLTRCNLDEDGLHRLREVTAQMSSEESNQFVDLLHTGLKTLLDSRSLIQEFNLQGPERGLPLPLARKVVLEDPEAYKNPVGLNDKVREKIREHRTQATQKLAARYKSKKEDENGNVHYEYGPRQVSNRNKQKASKVEKLRTSIRHLETQVRKDLKSGDERTRMTALAVALINDTYERVGNDQSAGSGHYGVTGWLRKHLTFSGKKATLKYTGKSGVRHTKQIEDSSLVSALKKAAKGKSKDDSLFGCEDGWCVNAKDVNKYLNPFEVTSKDIRGFHANREMCDRLTEIRKDGPELPYARKEKDKILKAEFKRALKAAASAVGHEEATLKNQYLVPGLETAYMKDGTVIKNYMTASASSRMRVASEGLTRYLEATKTQIEKDDEEAEKLVKNLPKEKPPRTDLRRKKVKVEDPDLDGMDADSDKDLSLNYKRVASFHQRVAALRVAVRWMARSYEDLNHPADPLRVAYVFQTKHQYDAYEKEHENADMSLHSWDHDGREKGKGEPDDTISTDISDESLEEYRKKREEELLGELRNNAEKEAKKFREGKGSSDKVWKSLLDLSIGDEVKDPLDTEYNKLVDKHLKDLFAGKSSLSDLSKWVAETEEGLKDEGDKTYRYGVALLANKSDPEKAAKILAAYLFSEKREQIEKKVEAQEKAQEKAKNQAKKETAAEKKKRQQALANQKEEQYIQKWKHLKKLEDNLQATLSDNDYLTPEVRAATKDILDYIGDDHDRRAFVKRVSQQLEDYSDPDTGMLPKGNSAWDPTMVNVADNDLLSLLGQTVALKDLDRSPFDEERESLADTLAKAIFGQRIVQNPEFIGRERVNTHPCTDNELHDMSKRAFDQYHGQKPHHRHNASLRLVDLIKSEKDRDKKAQLSARLDAIALSQVLHGERVVGRDQPSASFRALAQRLHKEDNAGFLLKAANSLYSAEGRGVIEDAMSNMTDEEFTDYAGGESGNYGSLVEVMNDPSMSDWQRKYARETIQKLAVNNMTTNAALMENYIQAAEGNESIDSLDEIFRDAVGEEVDPPDDSYEFDHDTWWRRDGRDLSRKEVAALAVGAISRRHIKKALSKLTDKVVDWENEEHGRESHIDDFLDCLMWNSQQAQWNIPGDDNCARHLEWFTVDNSAAIQRWAQHNLNGGRSLKSPQDAHIDAAKEDPPLQSEDLPASQERTPVEDFRERNSEADPGPGDEWIFDALDFSGDDSGPNQEDDSGPNLTDFFNAWQVDDVVDGGAEDQQDGSDTQEDEFPLPSGDSPEHQSEYERPVPLVNRGFYGPRLINGVIEEFHPGIGLSCTASDGSGVWEGIAHINPGDEVHTSKSVLLKCINHSLNRSEGIPLFLRDDDDGGWRCHFCERYKERIPPGNEEWISNVKWLSEEDYLRHWEAQQPFDENGEPIFDMREFFKKQDEGRESLAENPPFEETSNQTEERRDYSDYVSTPPPVGLDDRGELLSPRNLSSDELESWDKHHKAHWHHLHNAMKAHFPTHYQNIHDSLQATYDRDPQNQERGRIEYYEAVFLHQLHKFWTAHKQNHIHTEPSGVSDVNPNPPVESNWKSHLHPETNDVLVHSTHEIPEYQRRSHEEYQRQYLEALGYNPTDAKIRRRDRKSDPSRPQSRTVFKTHSSHAEAKKHVDQLVNEHGHHRDEIKIKKRPGKGGKPDTYDVTLYKDRLYENRKKDLLENPTNKSKSGPGEGRIWKDGDRWHATSPDGSISAPFKEEDLDDAMAMAGFKKESSRFIQNLADRYLSKAAIFGLSKVSEGDFYQSNRKFGGKSFQSSVYRGLHIFRGPLCAQPDVWGQNETQIPVRRKPLMAHLSKSGAKAVTTDLDKLAALFESEAETLGIPARIAQDFAYRCDLLSDTLDKIALDGLDPVDESKEMAPAVDPEEVGKEVGGPVSGDADEKSYMDGQFTQQVNRELRERQEGGDLDAPKTNEEIQSPQPGKQASFESMYKAAQELMSHTASEEDVVAYIGKLAQLEAQMDMISKAASDTAVNLRKAIRKATSPERANHTHGYDLTA
jgi:tRNA nucleotidyltransferase/poly(A) polymerase